MVLRAAYVAVATLVVACGGEIREVRPIAAENAVQCEVPRTSALLASAPMPVPTSENASHVIIRDDVDAGCDPEALGVVEAALGEDETSAMDALRARAAKLGADAVLEARRAIDSGRPRLVGTAVRCRDVRKERPYDVLEEIDLTDASGSPEAAFAKLRARAWELRADVVLNVHLRGDRTEVTHVTGTAIRYR
jgi:uncharacterized protein YbjQ (UPF0145 family)